VCAGHVTHVTEMRNSHKILIGKLQGKKSRRARYRREDNIKMQLREIEYEGVHRNQLIQGPNAITR